MLNNDERRSLKESHFVKVEGYFGEEQRRNLLAEFRGIIAKFYNAKELKRHSAYPSDQSEARESHAFMISEAPSPFPTIPHGDHPTLQDFLINQNKLLTEITQQDVAPEARSLVNFQSYTQGSKPVGEHFDGEYLRAEKSADGIEFQLLEGILPRYVGVLVIENANQGQGVELIHCKSREVFTPQLHAGDLVIFDNIQLRHRVPELHQPRISIGLRNFDHMPVHFARNDRFFLPNARYHSIPEGFISENADCKVRFRDFLENEWPEKSKNYDSYV